MDLMKISKEFKKLLTQNGEWNYDDSVVDGLIEETVEKKAALIDMFRKHPKWDEDQLCVHFDADFERKVDVNKYFSFLHWLKRESQPKINILNGEKKQQPGTETPMVTLITRKYESYWLCDMNLYDTLRNIEAATLLPEGECNEELYKDINALDKSFNFRPGMRLTKMMNKICRHYGWDKLPDFDKEFAKFADGVTPLQVKRHTTISVNPNDFLMMSNGNSWNSCHWIGYDADYNGCCRSGTISYIRDPHSFIVSIFDKDYEGEFLAEAPKINRQVFGYNDNQLLQSRLYPVSNDSGSETQYKEVRELVEMVIAECLEVPNRWVKGPSQNVMHRGTCYPDWFHYSRNCWTYVLRGHENDELKPIEMGKAPICLVCGEAHDKGDSLLCDECVEHYCADCGRRIHWDEEILWYDGDCYCTNCMMRCERCGDVRCPDNLIFLRDREEYWCDNCADGRTFYCDDCGEYYSNSWTDMYTTHDGRTICEHCRDSYVWCQDCDELYPEDEAELIDGRWVCEDCAERRREREEETA